MRPGALGDQVMTMPLLAALRRGLSDCFIEYAGSRSFAGWLQTHGLVDASRSLDGAEIGGLFVPDGAVPPVTEKFVSQFDLVISLWRDEKRLVAGALERLGARVAAVDPLPDVATIAGGAAPVHVARQILDRARACGVPIPSDVRCELPCIHPRPDSIRQAEEHLSRTGRHRVAIHPGSGSPEKNWPADRFGRVAWTLDDQCSRQGPISVRPTAGSSDQGLDIVLVCGPADAEAAEAFRSSARGLHLSELDNLPLPVLAAGLSLCDLLVGGDSGVSHLAAAVGVPTVTVFGPTDSRYWHPLPPNDPAFNDRHAVVRSPVDDISRVEVDAVIDAAVGALSA